MTAASCLCGRCRIRTVSGQPVIMPVWVPSAGWYIDRGYIRASGNDRVAGSVPTSARLHRFIVDQLRLEHVNRLDWRDPARRWLDDLAGLPVHHQDGDKRNNCPLNLVAMPAALNPSPGQFCYCPFTRRRMTKREFFRTYGALSA